MRRKERYHTERGKGIWERVGGYECRFGSGGTTPAFGGVVPELGGRGNELVDGVFGESEFSDEVEGELVRSVVTPP